MSEAFGSKAETSSSAARGLPIGRKTGAILRTVLYLCLAGVMGIMGYDAYRGRQDEAAMKKGQDRLVAAHGLVQPAHKRLAPEYSDKDGSLLADPPGNPADWLDPDTLVVAHYDDADVDEQLVDWNDFQAYLAAVTGKKVTCQEYLNSADEIAEVKSGAIQIVALHAADTPYLVNNAGFTPVAVLGADGSAHGNHLDVAVPAKSKIFKLADLRGHKLTCTRPDSITGYRAAIAVLAEEAGMRPDVDYFTIFSHGQKRSVLGLVGGDFEVAALSDDKVQSMLKQGSIKKADYRVIYQSQVIPRLTLGYAYNLKPELAAKVTAAALDFEIPKGPPDESTGKPTRFFAIDYKKDFEFVRKIDDSFDPRFNKGPKSKSTP